MSFLKSIKFVLTLTCEESARLVSASLDQELTRPQRLAMKLHALGCRSCRRFRRHVQFMREAISRRDAESISTSLSPEARDRIREAVAHYTGESQG